jgi:hypothetical protein
VTGASGSSGKKQDRNRRRLWRAAPPQETLEPDTAADNQIYASVLA